MITFVSSNFPCLEHNFMVPKVFEPLKFYCISFSDNYAPVDSVADELKVSSERQEKRESDLATPGLVV